MSQAISQRTGPEAIREEADGLQHCNSLAQLRAKLSFNLLRSAVLCVRGSRMTKHELTLILVG